MPASHVHAVGFGCVQVRHHDLKAAHDQLALNLQDHKSALAAAQVGQAFMSSCIS